MFSTTTGGYKWIVIRWTRRINCTVKWRHCNNPLGDYNKQKFGLNSGYTQFVNCLPEFSTMKPRRINNSCGRCDTPHRHSIHPVLSSPPTIHLEFYFRFNFERIRDLILHLSTLINIIRYKIIFYLIKNYEIICNDRF